MSGNLQKVVRHVLRTYNVDLNEFIKEDLERVAGDFLAQGLITQATVDSMSVTGVAPFQLASRLMSACQPSLVQFPEEKFPRFIAVLKKYETMQELAEKMEDEFKEAGISWSTSTFLKYLEAYMALLE